MRVWISLKIAPIAFDIRAGKKAIILRQNLISSLWCDDSCVMGDSTGPSYATCTDWLYGQCTAPINCSQYANCGTCTLSGCNWCESGSLNQCIPPDGQCAGSAYTNCSGKKKTQKKIINFDSRSVAMHCDSM